MENKKEYVHFGDKKFRKEKWNPIKNELFRNKPSGGLWASPVDSDCNWENWCIGEDFHTDRLKKSFRFTLLGNAKVLHICSVDDLRDIPRVSTLSTILPDFEELMNQGYDAMELHLSKDKYYLDDNRCLYFALYGWDCDSIIIFNPDIIIEK